MVVRRTFRFNAGFEIDRTKPGFVVFSFNFPDGTIKLTRSCKQERACRCLSELCSELASNLRVYRCASFGTIECPIDSFTNSVVQERIRGSIPPDQLSVFGWFKTCPNLFALPF